jgi:hypothetical protein
MRRRYLRFKKWALLKMIYALAAVLRFLKRQLPGGEERAYRRAAGRRRSTVHYARRIPRARRNRRRSRGASKFC